MRFDLQFLNSGFAAFNWLSVLAFLGKYLTLSITYHIDNNEFLSFLGGFVDSNFDFQSESFYFLKSKD